MLYELVTVIHKRYRSNSQTREVKFSNSVIIVFQRGRLIYLKTSDGRPACPYVAAPVLRLHTFLLLFCPCVGAEHLILVHVLLAPAEMFRHTPRSN